MKAWRADKFGVPAEVLTLQETELPQPPPGFMSLKVIAAGVGLPDVMMLKGVYPLVTRPPVSPGMEVSAEVIALGEGVSQFSVGDKIMTTAAAVSGWGGFAQYCHADATKAMMIPKGVTDIEAGGFLLPFRTAHIALVHRLKLQADETLLVLGAAGSSGASAIQMGKALGAKVIAAASSNTKLEFCKSCGADFVINYKSEDMSERIKEATNGKGVDVIFDPVGGDIGGLALKSIARLGRLGLIGMASGSWTALDHQDIVLKNYSVVGVFAGVATENEAGQTFADLGRLAEAGKIKTPVAKVFKFDEVRAALLQQENGDFLGKIIVEVE